MSSATVVSNRGKSYYAEANSGGIKLYIDILFHVEENKYDLDTDIKEAMLPEILSDYLRAQTGKGRDDRKPNRHKSFHIRIEIDLATDTFKTESDTGNAGLTTGIVMNVFQQEQAKASVE